MIDIKNIFPECDADTLLVELITERGHANHCKGSSKVSKALKRKEDVNAVFIGVIDSDEFKRLDQDKYLMNFSEIIFDGQNLDEGLVLKKYPNKNQYLVFVHKEFEPWAWKQASLAGINSRDYGFNDLDSFYNESKHYRTNESQKFKKFVNAIVKANPPGIALLRKWLVENYFD